MGLVPDHHNKYSNKVRVAQIFWLLNAYVLVYTML